MKVLIVSIAHEDSGNVDPQDPLAFVSRGGVREYLTRRGFKPSQAYFTSAEGDHHEDHWVREDSEGYETNASVIWTKVR